MYVVSQKLINKHHLYKTAMSSAPLLLMHHSVAWNSLYLITFVKIESSVMSDFMLL